MLLRKQIRQHQERWKSHFQASKFQNFIEGGHAPRPPLGERSALRPLSGQSCLLLLFWPLITKCYWNPWAGQALYSDGPSICRTQLFDSGMIRGAGMAQWWERLPPTNVSGFNFGPVSYVGWVCCWFSSLLRGYLSGFSGFTPSTKTNTPNSNSTRIADPHENQLSLMWLSV